MVGADLATSSTRRRSLRPGVHERFNSRLRRALEKSCSRRAEDDDVDADRRRTAYHEAAMRRRHAHPGGSDRQVSIIPRARLGITFSAPDDDRFNYTTETSRR